MLLRTVSSLIFGIRMCHVCVQLDLDAWGFTLPLPRYDWSDKGSGMSFRASKDISCNASFLHHRLELYLQTWRGDAQFLPIYWTERRPDGD